ncbi:MAG: hypothetical protein HQL48_11210 [Gammaproteobacteria bacterium]|nr:hypothetical protein [Gammaproteobacteria bacterium]
MQPKRLLLVRSVSLQQLDLILPQLRQRFAGVEIAVITHAHSVPELTATEGVAEVVVYPYKRPFSPFWRWGERGSALAARLSLHPSEGVVVPVTNHSGYGFLNVLLFALSIPAESRWMFTAGGELEPLAVGKLLLRGVKQLLLATVALLVTVALTPFVLLLLPLLFLGQKGDDSG